MPMMFTLLNIRTRTAVNTMLGMRDLNPGTDFALFKQTTPCKYITYTYRMKQQLTVITEILKIAPSYSTHKIKIRMLQESKFLNIHPPM